MANPWPVLLALVLTASAVQCDVSVRQAWQAGLYPWVASLGFYANNTYFHYCGGVLIASQFVVTAAHCIDPATVAKDVVRIGGQDLTVPSQFEENRIDRVVVHPLYKYNSDKYDLAVVKIKVPSKRAPIAMLQTPGSDDNSPAMFVGWGARDDTNLGQSYNVVQNFQSVISRAACPKTFAVHLICSNVQPQQLVKCLGDSGGAVIGNGRVLGVTARGAGCNGRVKYGIYTRLGSFSGWIKTAMAAKVPTKAPAKRKK